jgi:DNA-binding beta-propeller fold protein YncE
MPPTHLLRLRALDEWRGAHVLGLSLLVGVGLACLAQGSPAQAARGYILERSFGQACTASPCPQGQFNEPESIAVNEASGTIYVVDKGDNRVEMFNQDGTPAGEINGSGELANEKKPAGSGGLPGETPTGRFDEPEGIAVDNTCHIHERATGLPLTTSECETLDPSNSDVYIQDTAHKVIDKYTPTGEYVAQLTELGELLGITITNQGELWTYARGSKLYRFSDTTPQNTFAEEVRTQTSGGAVQGLAASPDGDLYVGAKEGEPRTVFKVNSLGEVVFGGRGVFGEAASSAGMVGVDDASGEVFVDGGGSVGRFTSAGGAVEHFGAGVLTGGRGVAVDSGLVTVMVADAAADRVDVFGLEPPGVPSAGEEAAGDVTSSSVEFSATVNPRGGESEYAFEYGLCEPSGCQDSGYTQTSLLPVGSGFEPKQVSMFIGGLQPASEYHFRVAARNQYGLTHGQETLFRTQLAGGEFGLPDDRVWELVSPPDKHGALLEPIDEQGIIQAAANGNAITYLSNSPTQTEVQANSNLSQILSTRTSEGWKTSDIMAPEYGGAVGASLGLGFEYRFFSQTLSQTIVQPFGSFPPPGSPQSLSDEATEQTAFLRNDYQNEQPQDICTNSCYQPLVTAANTPPGTQFGECTPSQRRCGPRFVGASPDLNNIILASTIALTTTPINGEKSLYKWVAGQPHGTPLELINVLNDGTVIAPATLGSREAGGNEYAAGAVADGGARVVWQSLKEHEEHLYVRDSTRGETLQLDAVQGGTGEGPVSPRYWFASTDGSRILFTDGQRLTPGAVAEAGRPDLYECDIVQGAGGLECKLEDLTPTAGGEPADVKGVLGASPDGSWVFYVADGVITQAGAPVPGAVKGDCETGASEHATCDLYVRHDGHTKLVASLSFGDVPDWYGALPEHTARVVEGGLLVFMSQRSLTGYDNHDASSGANDEEVYLYDGASGQLACSSCNPTGAQPAGIEYSKVNNKLVGGDRIWSQTTWLAANVPGWTPYRHEEALYQSRYLSQQGRVFFNSSDALVPADVDGTEDVYEWEPQGVGSCQPGADSASIVFKAARVFDVEGREGEEPAGCVALISSGQSTGESGFIDADEKGENIFFLTSSQLVAQDTDTAIDVYDARQCPTSTPCAPAPPAAPSSGCATAEECRSAPAPQPAGVFTAPTSETITAAVNTTTPPATTIHKIMPTPAQELTKDLRKCRAKHNKRARTTCEARARHKYHPAAASRRRPRR